MDIVTLRRSIRRQVLAAAAADERVVGLLDYGATGAGRSDRWSDLDLALFLEDIFLPTFERDWRTWAAQFGPLLLAYIGGVGHPWAIYDAEPLPLRVDFAFYPRSGIQQVCDLALAPEAANSIVLYDDTDGSLTHAAATLVGQSLAPRDMGRTFEQVAGDFWYYLLRTYTKVQRGELWAARHDFNFVVVGNLLALLRLEAGAVARWRAASASIGLERDISPERLRALDDACIPGPGPEALVQSLRRTAALGEAVCRTLTAQETFALSAQLMRRVRQALDANLAA